MTVTLTDRLGLTRWGSDSDAWSREQIDGNVAKVEELAVIGTQGNASDRPAAGVQRRLYLATDVERVYLDDGDEWYELLVAGVAPASAIVFTPVGSIAATDVQAALAEVASEAGTNLGNHTGAAAGAHAATAISYAGSTNLSATTVEAALDELDTEKAPKAAPTFTGTTTVDALTATGNVLLGNAPTDLIGFYGAAGVARPGTYNLTGSADRTLGAYASDAESAAYAGVPAALADAATRDELNQLRAAYENLRTYVEDLGGVAIATATDLKTLGLVG